MLIEHGEKQRLPCIRRDNTLESVLIQLTLIAFLKYWKEANHRRRMTIENFMSLIARNLKNDADKFDLELSLTDRNIKVVK
ncbi:unnamed protein product [Heligmosomoides polygyrus]|uniref:Uncharacterized protein n=1 Tax=Heligmosomoides polygyrus TaxID=6339 RepID=A0A183G749_HELPZ|nr:unnamed protein product [Heligmosomoides polygyrus]